MTPLSRDYLGNGDLILDNEEMEELNWRGKIKILVKIE